MLPPGINRVTQLIVFKVYKVNNRLQTVEKKRKKIMHGLHYMFYFEKKEKHSSSIFTVFICGNLSTTMFFFFLSRFLNRFFFFFFCVKGVSYCHKMYRLRCCKDPKPSSIYTNMNCMCKQSCSSA